MIVAEIKGDLVKMVTKAINTNTRFIAGQGCNMQGIQGAGIAGQFRKIPNIFAVDKEAINRSPDNPSVAGWNLNNQLFFNMYTQELPGANAQYDFVEKSLQAVYDILCKINRENEPVFLPLIGCGIGGLEWEDVRKILEESSVRFIVVHWEG